MKTSAFPRLSSPSDSQPSFRHPLESAIGCFILLLCAGLHFYALGSKADPSILAFDESETWQLPASQEPTASEVLFAVENVWETPGKSTIGLNTKLVSSPAASMMLGTPLQASSSKFEAALVALNFRY